MAIKTHTQNCDFKLSQSRNITSWLKDTARQENMLIGEINIVFCSDEELLKINKQYLNHDYLTDIITFDYSFDRTMAGDIFISVDTVRTNAETYCEGFRRELLRVLVHGILHLCGYKDKSKGDAKIMRQKENFYLAQYFGA